MEDRPMKRRMFLTELGDSDWLVYYLNRGCYIGWNYEFHVHSNILDFCFDAMKLIIPFDPFLYRWVENKNKSHPVKEKYDVCEIR